MLADKIRTAFLEFFKARGHAIVPSSSLIPDDPSVLLTTAGMQQFKKYYTGEADALRDFGSRNTVSVQKSFRTSDIDEVGDERHLTFFEMLGNFSFGGYFKREAIVYAHEFLTKTLGLGISYVTVFQGMPGVPKDEESIEIWRSLGVTDIREELWDVFWGPTGSDGPCGPTTEIYCKNGSGDDVEVWNIVFNQFFFPGSREELQAGNSGKKLEPLKTPGVDTGMGLERLAMIAQGTRTIFETDLFAPILRLLPAELSEREQRVVADHIRGGVFLIADGVLPANKGAGYILRRLLRRAIVHLYQINADFDFTSLYRNLIGLYVSAYPELNHLKFVEVFSEEHDRFKKTLRRGLQELQKLSSVDGKIAFQIFESHGLPFEIIKDIAKDKARGATREAFEAEFKKHQEISRAGLEKKFGGHGLLLDTGELKAGNEEELKKVTRLHTATHMLQQALRAVLGGEVHQAGSDITAERTRFDFTFSRKLTVDEVKKIEELVNQKVGEALPMQKVVLPKAEAEKTGALYSSKEKYPDSVNVYFLGESLAVAWSKEFCGGPHVLNSREVGKFKIIKEEAVAAGVRRIRATVN